MFHPGGFGDYDYENRKLPMRKDPSIVRALFFFVAMLSIWVACFLIGLSFGFGWYAWPSGTFVLLGVFLVYNFFRHPKRNRRG